MTSRVAATIVGLMAGIAAALMTLSQWNALIAGVRADSPAWAEPVSRLAWVVAISVCAFALVALLIAGIATLIEAWRAHIHIERLRHDPMLEGWKAEDWRAAFAGTAAADHAEAVISAIMPGAGQEEDTNRRVFADPALLLSLENIWLDRGTLTATINPLPNIVLATGALLALLRYANTGAGWEIALAAGIAGWTAIVLARYVVRALLTPAIELAVRSATAAIRPLTPALALDIAMKRFAPVQGLQTTGTEIAAARPDTDAMAAALRSALAEPLMRIAEAADRLNGADGPHTGHLTIRREEISTRPSINIEAALAEIRMGIEQLLDSPTSGADGADLNVIAETIRSALAEQTEALRQSSAALSETAERIAQFLSSAAAGATAGDAAFRAELVATLNRLAGQSSGERAPGMENPAIASALATSLREFDDR